MEHLMYRVQDLTKEKQANYAFSRDKYIAKSKYLS